MDDTPSNNPASTDSLTSHNTSDGREVVTIHLWVRPTARGTITPGELEADTRSHQNPYTSANDTAWNSRLERGLKPAKLVFYYSWSVSALIGTVFYIQQTYWSFKA